MPLDLEEGANEKASFRDHIDNPVVVLIIITLAVYAFGAFGRSAGNRFNKPGIVSFFGG
jgi:hypothetical protein